MKKYCTLIIIYLFISTGVKAQSDYWRTKNILSFNWEVGIPLNTNYLKTVSAAGANLDYRHFINNNFSLGVAWHWNTFEEYLSPRVYEKPDGSQAVYTDMVVQAYVAPMLLKGHYYFDAGNIIKPYVGLGIGAQYAKQQVFYNIFTSETDNWGFAVRPEAGLMYQLPNKRGGLHFNAGFNYATNQNEAFKIDGLKHIGLSLGGWWNLY